MKDESYAVAETLYDGLTEGEALPDSYIAKYKDVILKRVVLAGARLAYAIEQIFGNKKSTSLEILL